MLIKLITCEKKMKAKELLKNLKKINHSEYNQNLDFYKNLIKNYDSKELNTVDNKGNSLLHICAMNGWVELTEELLKQGIQTDLYNQQGLTAAHLAAQHLNYKVLRLIIESPSFKKSFPNIQDCLTLEDPKEGIKYKDRSLLYLAVKHAGPDKPGTALQLIADYPALIPLKAANGQTALYAAVGNGNILLIEKLLEKGCPFDGEDKYGHDIYQHANISIKDATLCEKVIVSLNYVKNEKTSQKNKKRRFEEPDSKKSLVNTPEKIQKRLEKFGNPNISSSIPSFSSNHQVVDPSLNEKSDNLKCAEKFLSQMATQLPSDEQFENQQENQSTHWQFFDGPKNQTTFDPTAILQKSVQDQSTQLINDLHLLRTNLQNIKDPNSLQMINNVLWDMNQRLQFIKPACEDQLIVSSVDASQKNFEGNGL